MEEKKTEMGLSELKRTVEHENMPVRFLCAESLFSKMDLRLSDANTRLPVQEASLIENPVPVSDLKLFFQHPDATPIEMQISMIDARFKGMAFRVHGLELGIQKMLQNHNGSGLFAVEPRLVKTGKETLQ